MELQDKLNKYNLLYQFKEHPDQFRFCSNPERMIIRNEALRTRNKKLYETYLRERYPEHADGELAQFDKSLYDTKLFTVEEANDFFQWHNISALQADLSCNDPDTIFGVSAIKSDVVVQDINDFTETIGAFVSIATIDYWDRVWIDVSEIRETNSG